MSVQQINNTRWTFTGHHTTGVIDRVRDGLVTRYIAKNSNGQKSPMKGSPQSAESWLRAHDTTRG